MRDLWAVEAGLVLMAQGMVVSIQGLLAWSGWPAPRLWQRLARWRSAAWDLWPVLSRRPARLLVARWALSRARAGVASSGAWRRFPRRSLQRGGFRTATRRPRSPGHIDRWQDGPGL